MKFFLQNNMVDRIVLPALEYAKKNNIEVIDQSCVLDMDLDKFHDWDEPTVIIGSVGLMKQCAAHPKAKKWIHYTNEGFDAINWKKALHSRFLNGDGYSINAYKLLKKMRKNGNEMHIRPLNDDKAFIGGIYDATKFEEQLNDRHVSEDVMAFASCPKIMKHEMRCWVYKNHIIAASYYKVEGEHSRVLVPNPMADYNLNTLVNMYSPAEFFVMDVSIVNGDYKVIEYNPIHGSGWYAANTNYILDVWTSMYRDDMAYDFKTYNLTKITGDLPKGPVTEKNIEWYKDPDNDMELTIINSDSREFKYLGKDRHSWDSASLTMSQGLELWYLFGNKVNEVIYKEWLIEQGIDINNLTPEDKMLIKMKWA